MIAYIYGPKEQYNAKTKEKYKGVGNNYFHLNPKCTSFLCSKGGVRHWYMTDKDFTNLTYGQMEVLHKIGALSSIVAWKL